MPPGSWAGGTFISGAGRENVLAKYPVVHPVPGRRTGVEGGRTGKPGGRSVSFSSVIGRRGRRTGGVPRTFKMQISERARRSGTRNADVNVRASAGQVFYWGQLPFPSPERPPAATPAVIPPRR